MNGRVIRRGLALALLLSVFVVVRAPTAAHACSCAGSDFVVANPQLVDAAFVGTIADAPDPDRRRADPLAPVSVTFAVDAVYTGALPATVTVRYDDWGTMCHFPDARLGARVDVALRREGQWFASGCSTFTGGALVGLGAPRPPLTDAEFAALGDDGSGARVLVIWGAVIAAVAIGTAFVVRRRGHSSEG